MEKTVFINATTWMTSADIIAFSAEFAVIKAGIKSKSSNAEIMKTFAPLHAMILWTPSFRDDNTKHEETDAFIAQTKNMFLKYNAFDWKGRLNAIKTHNLLKPFGNLAENAVMVVRSDFLIITSAEDDCVYPEPS